MHHLRCILECNRSGGKSLGIESGQMYDCLREGFGGTLFEGIIVRA